MDALVPSLVLTQAALLAAIAEYITDSKAGDTLSYRETALLDVGTAAKSSAKALWDKLAYSCVQYLPVEIMSTEEQIGEGLEFACTEDLTAGQIVRLGDGKIVPAPLTAFSFFG